MRCNPQIKLIGFYFAVLSILATGLANGQNTRVSLKGTIEQIIVEENPARYEYVLAAEDGKRYQISVAQSLVGYANRRVSLSGVLDGKRLSSTENFKITEQANALSTPAPTFGKRKVLTLLVNFTNNQAQPISVEQARERVFTGAKSANHFFKEASLYRYELTGVKRADGDVLGWLTLPFNESCNGLDALSESADTLARQNGYEPNDYNSVLYVFPNLCGGGNSTRAQMGQIGDTSKTWRVWFNASEFGEYQIPHELGHNLGLNHANAFVCSGADIPNNCQGLEYGDLFDEMGPGFGSAAGFFFNNYYRLCLGWLTGRAQTVTESGDYTLVAPSLPAKGNQVLRIQAKPPVPPYAGFSYTLEIRRPFSYDNRFFGVNSNFNPTTAGVSIRYT